MLSRLIRELYPCAEARGLPIATDMAIFGDDPKTSWRIPDLVPSTRPSPTRPASWAGRRSPSRSGRPDDSFNEVGFYLAHGVGQVLSIDPDTETVLADYLNGENVDRTAEHDVPCLQVTLSTVGGRLAIGAS